LGKKLLSYYIAHITTTLQNFWNFYACFNKSRNGKSKRNRFGKYLVNKYPDTSIWRTETPGFSPRNHHFYINKCGCKDYRIENPKDKKESSFLLDKVMNIV